MANINLCISKATFMYSLFCSLAHIWPEMARVFRNTVMKQAPPVISQTGNLQALYIAIMAAQIWFDHFSLNNMAMSDIVCIFTNNNRDIIWQK